MEIRTLNDQPRESVLRNTLNDVVASNAIDPGVRLHEDARRDYLILRGDGGDEVFRHAVQETLSARLPVEPGRWSAGRGANVYWLGPREWLLSIAAGSGPNVQNRLRQTLVGHIAVVDTSGGLIGLNISGDAAGMVLKKASTYDFHARHFAPGRCVQTNFANAGALIAGNKNGSFDLIIKRSYADYLLRWIADAAAEYGLQISVGFG